MTECFQNYGTAQLFGYKRNVNGKHYLGRFELREKDDRFEIWSLGVAEEYRNKGYATRMLTEFLSQFKSEKPLVLYVYKANKIAIRLYEKVGFVIVDKCYFDPKAYEMQWKGSGNHEKS